ncbi:hypothetical protein [Brevibacillus brevis]|uniref:hypothetical protein n=1 Tax=Brevibacillus brevis TaxID=1393 RepID=UPI000D10906E|nr:hypothetical protein [Brevibacillus brevis]PSJ66634.1 hypothetical protein C7J99_24795 [Brevibacillus brevis]RED20835.1 hypothetical protein DES34_1354 [Brevibacillus brevis]VEF87235.1 Uncharacterised protein [Brevibacillus brevis]VEF87597.1 Uncharacterised protein [Brevibacillus brevis]GEC93903.1 hypothetical protein BBR01nite_62340 [Brevibacillus brevis]
MLKEALQYLIGLGNTEVFTTRTGQEFASQPIHLIKNPTPEALVVRNLSGLVDYLIHNFDDQPPVLVHVASPTMVDVFSSYNQDFNRNHLIQAKALLPRITFGQFMDAESFNILLQSCFVPNDARAIVLKVIGNLKEETVSNVGDDGVSQQVTAKTGVATVENIVVPNPVSLKPFRTFVEIEQPESEFVFRMKSGPSAALFEADGGAWELTAIARIKEYLQGALEEEINSGKVTIIA